MSAFETRINARIVIGIATPLETPTSRPPAIAAAAMGATRVAAVVAEGDSAAASASPMLDERWGDPPQEDRGNPQQQHEIIAPKQGKDPLARAAGRTTLRQ